MSHFSLVAFDADDTLWHNEKFYLETQEKFNRILAKYHEPVWIQERLYQTEMRNLQHFGYGVKAFTLSMIETAIELTEGRISGAEIKPLIDQARRMINNQIELLDYTAEVIPHIAHSYPLMLITKGDLMDQERKLERSGLQGYFKYVEVVSQKTPSVYNKLLNRYAIQPDRFLMVGNSLRSDILPVLELGGYAVHIPFSLTWQHEEAKTPPEDQAGFYQLEHLGLLPDLLQQIERKASGSCRS